MRTIGLNHFKAQRHYRNTPRGFTLLEVTIVLAILAALAALVVPLVGGNVEEAKLDAAKVSVQAVRDTYMNRFIRDMKYTEWFQSNSNNVYVNELFVNSRISLTDPISGKYDSSARKGWNGPYLDSSRSGPFPAPSDMNPLFAVNYQGRNFYGPSATPLYGDASLSVPCLTSNDPWGNPIVIQYPVLATMDEILRYARVVSAGPNGVIDTPRNGSDMSLVKLAGRQRILGVENTDARGDDIVIFLNRADVYE